MIPSDYGDADLKAQFKAIDGMSEHDARLCAKKAYSDLWRHIHDDAELRGQLTRENERLRECVRGMETRIAERNQKLRDLFGI